MVGEGRSGLEKYCRVKKWDQTDKKERIKIAPQKGTVKRNRVQKKTREKAGKKRREGSEPKEQAGTIITSQFQHYPRG